MDAIVALFVTSQIFAQCATVAKMRHQLRGWSNLTCWLVVAEWCSSIRVCMVWTTLCHLVIWIVHAPVRGSRLLLDQYDTPGKLFRLALCGLSELKQFSLTSSWMTPRICLVCVSDMSVAVLWFTCTLTNRKGKAIPLALTTE